MSFNLKMLRWTLALALASSASAFAAQTVPVPRQKPKQDGVSTAVLIPIPRQKPGRAAAPAPSQPPADWPAESNGWPADAVRAARADCTQLLKGLDIAYTPLPAIGRDGGCGTPAPIEITSIAGVTLTPSATTNCAMAVQLHQWITASVQPAAKAKLKTRVTGIRTASSYVCRGRNGLKGGKLSEHGRANALDMAGFSFAKSDDVTVGDGWGGVLQTIGLSRSGSFLNVIRDDACSHFATVLGPGSDRYHGDHFHVDAIRRKSGYRICK